MIASVKTTGDNLKAASTEIRHSPWRLLYKPSQGRAGQPERLRLGPRSSPTGANELNDAAQALRDATNSKEANRERIQKLVNRLEKTFQNFHTVEDKLWRGVKE